VAVAGGWCVDGGVGWTWRGAGRGVEGGEWRLNGSRGCGILFAEGVPEDVGGTDAGGRGGGGSEMGVAGVCLGWVTARVATADLRLGRSGGWGILVGAGAGGRR